MEIVHLKEYDLYFVVLGLMPMYLYIYHILCQWSNHEECKSIHFMNELEIHDILQNKTRFNKPVCIFYGHTVYCNTNTQVNSNSLLLFWHKDLLYMYAVNVRWRLLTNHCIFIDILPLNKVLCHWFISSLFSVACHLLSLSVFSKPMVTIQLVKRISMNNF